MNTFKRRADIIEAILQNQITGGIALVQQTESGYLYREKEYASLPDLEQQLEKQGIETIIVDDIF